MPINTSNFVETQSISSIMKKVIRVFLEPILIIFVYELLIFEPDTIAKYV